AFAHPLGPIIRHHHEHWDGTGYPDGLAGEAIPLAARILTLCDSLDKARRETANGSPTVEYLVQHVARAADSQLDPRLVELYCTHADAIEAMVDARLGAPGMISAPTSDSDALLDDIGQARREAVMVYDMTRQMSSSLDVDETLKTAMRGLAQVVQASSTAVYLSDDTGGHVAPRYASGPLAPVLLNRSFAPGEGITGWVFQTAEPVIGADPQVDFGVDVGTTEPAFRSAALFPLIDDEGPLGVVAFYDDKPDAFNSNHVRIMESIGPQIARALRNALLYRATQNTSMTDVLTGLPNSRYLYGQIDKELARATRRATPLCVVVMDLDGFKAVNDTHGHRAGDAVLRTVARTLQDTYRAGDTVVRYAGDEFVALLPESSREECAAVIERVQAAVSNTVVKLDGGENVSVGISAGFSCFPFDGSTLEDLIHRADKEMYRDKSERKSPALSAAYSRSPDSGTTDR
ncbi:MAG: diguanylate cyclase, partial [Acidobacteriota bacterium]